MASSTPRAKRAGAAKGRSFLAWQGFLGNLRQRPLFAAAIAGVSLLLIAGAVYFVVYPESWAWYHWWQAERAAQDYDFSTARKSLEKCAQVWTKSGEVHFHLARACRRDGDYPAAKAELLLARRYRWSEEALELETKLTQAQSGNIRPVEKHLHACLERCHEDRLLILEALVIGYLQNNYLSEAHQWLVVWNKQYPHMWQPHLLLAAVYERRHRAGLAVAEYQKVLELKPNQPEASYQLASLLVGYAKQYDDALPHYETYVRLRPGDAGGWVGLGRCQRALRDYAPALASAEQAMQLEPEHPGALQLLGLIAWDQERLPEALEWLRKAWQLAPHELDTNHALAVVLRELGQESEAKPYEQRRHDLERELRRLSDILQEIHDLEFNTEATASPARAREQAVVLRREVAAIYSRVGDETSSLGWLLSALQQAPEDPETRRQVTEMQARLRAPDRRGQPYAPTTPQGLGEPSRPRATGR